MPDQKFGTFEDIVLMAAEPLRPVAERLRDVLMSIDPDACVVVRLGDRAATFGVGPKKMSEGYCYIIPHNEWINLGFYKGAELSDPQGLLEGTGAKMRHFKVRTLDACDSPHVAKLIREAVGERKRALGRN